MISKRSILGAPSRYLSARQRWKLAGHPVRSDEEVLRIFEEICTPCEHFRKRSGRAWCQICQCSLNLGKTLNKIRWATESCPVDKWTAEVELPEQELTETADAASAREAASTRKQSVGTRSREILAEMTPEERLATHQRAILERRAARRSR